MVVSARTGAGLDDLAAAVEAALPQWDREVSAVVPYVRGDLVARAHQEGEVLAVRHGATGTELTARVPPDLAAEIDRWRPGAGRRHAGRLAGLREPSRAGCRGWPVSLGPTGQTRAPPARGKHCRAGTEFACRNSC